MKIAVFMCFVLWMVCVAGNKHAIGKLVFNISFVLCVCVCAFLCFLYSVYLINQSSWSINRNSPAIDELIHATTFVFKEV